MKPNKQYRLFLVEAHELYQSLPNVCFEGNFKLQEVFDCAERGDKLTTATSDNGRFVDDS